ncbi:3-deoxy-manno-octulosonate cytidylyltransferase [Celerinatantimonas sp. YJH-8]|uniref:3-deoxy-manno-octulosonate cytidylyltransferase n=1 Tax=Celerinatantimonas sp. YJH-8 TaxID=3228714 RepID=UPI0038CB96F1
MSYTIIIPARFASTRLPGKPLLDLVGKPMIQRVVEQANLCQANRVIVATDDQRIADAVTPYGTEVCMTRSDHQSGTERLAEVVKNAGIADDEIIVNIQGDEPLIQPQLVDQVAQLLLDDPSSPMATLGTAINDAEQIQDPNAVKVVVDKNGRALYFSRAPIPFSREGEWPAEYYLRHIGMYGYRAGFLDQYIHMEVSPLEQIEKLEQLRVLWHGYSIKLAKAVIEPGLGVDTQADLEKVRAIIQASLR